MQSKFEININEIRHFIKKNALPVVRFLYTEYTGNLLSITVPSSKILNSDIYLLQNVLTVDNQLLYADAQTMFIDPCSIQANCCVLANFTHDARDNLHSIDKHIITTVNFKLHNDTLSGSHDLRNEIALESIKVGIDIRSHYELNNIQSISYDAYTILNFADSLQKLKFLIYNITSSYGCKLLTSDSTITFQNFTNVIPFEYNPYLISHSLRL